MYKTPGIKYIETKGNESGAYLDVELDMEKLSAFEISPNEVSSALRSTSEGNNDNSSIVIRVSPQLRSIEDMQNIIIAVKNEQVIYLRDIARISMKTDIKEIIRENNQRAININLVLIEEDGFEEVYKKIESVVSEIIKRSPAGFSYVISDLH